MWITRARKTILMFKSETLFYCCPRESFFQAGDHSTAIDWYPAAQWNFYDIFGPFAPVEHTRGLTRNQTSSPLVFQISFSIFCSDKSSLHHTAIPHFDFHFTFVPLSNFQTHTLWLYGWIALLKIGLLANDFNGVFDILSVTLYDTVSDVVESGVHWGSNFQIGSRVLKICFKPIFMHIYGMQYDFMHRSCWNHSNFENSWFYNVISTSDPQNHCLLGSRNRVAVAVE